MLTIIIVVGGLFLALILGLLVLLRLAFCGHGFLSTKAQTPADAAARAITGLYVRMPGRIAEDQPRRVPDDPR